MFSSIFRPCETVSLTLRQLTNIVGCVAGCLEGVPGQRLFGKPEICQLEHTARIYKKQNVLSTTLLEPRTPRVTSMMRIVLATAYYVQIPRKNLSV